MMPLQFTRIGLALLLLVLSAVHPSVALAAESASFTLEGASVQTAAPGLQSDTYRGQGAVHWHARTVTGNTYQIVPSQDAGEQPPAPSSSSVASSASSSSAQQASSQDGPSPGGHRGNAASSVASDFSSARSSAGTTSRASSRPASAAANDAPSSPASASRSAVSVGTASADTSSAGGIGDVGSSASGDSQSAGGGISSSAGYRTPHSLPSHQLHPAAGPAAPYVPGFLPIAGLAVIAILLPLTLCVALGLCTEAAGGWTWWMIPFWKRDTKDEHKDEEIAKRAAHRRRLWILTLLAAAAALAIPAIYQATAASIPLSHAYDGRLLTSSGSPVTTSVNIRLSYWSDADVAAGDIAVDGSIDTGASAYLGWNEVHTVTPDSHGYFSVEMGSISALPTYASLPAGATVSLQVEVKAASDPATSYEVLDPDTADTAVDRTPILSVPYASIAETLQRRSIGTGSGSIPLLQSGGLLPASVVPGGTNRDAFTIDADNSAATAVTLRFGESLNETLSYSVGSGRFEFSDDVYVDGDLTVTGTVNGVDLSTINDPIAVTGAVVLHPGYEGAAFQADGADNVGQLSISHDNINLKNFYLWTSSRTTLQDYDVLLRFTLPDDFTGWDESITLQYRSTSADSANNELDVQVYDTNGSPVTLSGSAVNLAGTSWQSARIEFTGSPTWTPGQQILLRFKLSAKDDFQMHLGELRLSMTRQER